MLVFNLITLYIYLSFVLFYEISNLGFTRTFSLEKFLFKYWEIHCDCTVTVKIHCDSEIHSEGYSEIHYHSAPHSALHSEFSLSPCIYLAYHSEFSLWQYILWSLQWKLTVNFHCHRAFTVHLIVNFHCGSEIIVHCMHCECHSENPNAAIPCK